MMAAAAADSDAYIMPGTFLSAFMYLFNPQKMHMV